MGSESGRVLRGKLTRSVASNDVARGKGPSVQCQLDILPMTYLECVIYIVHRGEHDDAAGARRYNR